MPKPPQCCAAGEMLWCLLNRSKDKHKNSVNPKCFPLLFFCPCSVGFKTSAHFFRELLFSPRRSGSSDISEAWNAFFSICFPKSSHPFWGSLFALRTSVTVSELAGTTPSSSAGTSASHSHLCPGPPNPFLSVNLPLSLSPFSVFSLSVASKLQTHTNICTYTYITHGGRTRYGRQIYDDSWGVSHQLWMTAVPHGTRSGSTRCGLLRVWCFIELRTRCARG